METTYQTIILYIVLPVMGILLILFAALRVKGLRQLPVHLGLKSVGLDLSCSAFTFLIILGLVALALGIFFHFRDYETQVAELREELNQTNTEISTINKVLQGFRVYAMNFNLVFPEEDTVNTQEVSVRAYICKQGTGQPTLHACEPVVGFSNDIWVNIDHLNPGDKLRIEADDAGGRYWQSANVLEIPKAQLQMKKVTE